MSAVRRRSVSFRASPRRAREALLRIARHELTPEETAAAVAVTQARADGTIASDPRTYYDARNRRMGWRFEVTVHASNAEAVLRALRDAVAVE